LGVEGACVAHLQVTISNRILQQPDLQANTLVFLDETAVTTDMTRRYGRSLPGTRCLTHAPRGHYKSSTFIAGLLHDRVCAPMTP